MKCGSSHAQGHAAYLMNLNLPRMLITLRTNHQIPPMTHDTLQDLAPAHLISSPTPLSPSYPCFLATYIMAVLLAWNSAFQIYLNLTPQASFSHHPI